MRQIEKHSKKYPVGDDGLPIPTRGKAKKTIVEQQKRKAATAKESEKSRMDALTRHRSNQTQETRERMERNLKESNKRYRTSKEIFIVRWFRPKDDVEKIEKRQAKEVQKRMAATRKKAEKYNKELGVTNVSKTAQKRKVKPPNPKDMPHGGGGVYKEGKSKSSVRPSDMPQGGGGTYVEGKSKSRVSPSDIQHGGGGNYQTGKTGIFKKLFSKKSKSR